MQEVLDTGVVEAQQQVEDVLNESFARFQAARATILSNKPEVYNSLVVPGKVTAVTCPQPSVHARAECQ